MVTRRGNAFTDAFKSFFTKCILCDSFNRKPKFNPLHKPKAPLGDFLGEEALKKAKPGPPGLV